MYKILILSKYSRLGASSRLRTHQYIPFLENAGFSTTVSSLYDDDYLKGFYKNKSRSLLKIITCYIKRFKVLFFTGDYDLLIVEKECFPYLPYFFEYIFLRNKKFVVDYDDAIFHNYDKSKKLLVRFFLSKKIRHIMRLAETVIVGNDYLKSYAEKSLANRIVEIPTVVDLKRYSAKTVDVTKGKLCVGWIGSPFTQKYLISIRDELFEAYKQKSFKLLLVGASTDIKNELYGLEVDVVDWSESSEVSLINKMDIGIMPLPNEPFEQGKCGYKLIQYMACGIPVIASDVGVNKKIIELNECGLLVNDSNSFSKSLVTLLLDVETRLHFAKNALVSINSLYNLDFQSEILINCLNVSILNRDI